MTHVTYKIESWNKADTLKIDENLALVYRPDESTKLSEHIPLLVKSFFYLFTINESVYIVFNKNLLVNQIKNVWYYNTTILSCQTYKWIARFPNLAVF